MKYTCVDTAEYLYPDITEYTSGTDRIDILTPRGSFACAQVFLTEGSGSVSVACEGWNPEVYEMIAIPVEENNRITEENTAPHTPERKAPFDVYDCLKPSNGKLTFKDGVAAVYFSLWIPKDAPVGVTEGSIKLGDIRIPVTIEVSSAVVPDETMSVLMYYIKPNVCIYHKVEEGSDEFERLETEYLMMLRRMRQNALWIPETENFPVTTVLGENRYEFDFSHMEAFIGKAMTLGYKKVYHRLGFRESWNKSTILVGGLPCMSFEGYCYLAQYLPALRKFLEERGWLDKFMLSILDEPRANNAMEYRALCNLARKFAPGMKLIDAISFGYVDGTIDICVPMTCEYEEHREDYEAYRKYGDEMWSYDCCIPRGNGYINRFMDGALLATRYHGWGNYAYNLTGYLHWAANFYQPGQDPFTQSCPLHQNTDDIAKIPAGDTHIMYPGEDGPWMSVRLENYRAGFEEYEMLRAVASEDKALADAVCGKVFRKFNDVEYDARVFRAARNELIRAMEKYSN